jgi:hypothetical protein
MWIGNTPLSTWINGSGSSVASPPAREAIGPDGRQIRHASEDDQGTEMSGKIPVLYWDQTRRSFACRSINESVLSGRIPNFENLKGLSKLQL